MGQCSSIDALHFSNTTLKWKTKKRVRTNRITKMYMYTKCKFKNMSIYNWYWPIISNYYNLDLMLVASDLHRDSLSRPWLWLFVAFRFHFRYTFVSPSLSGWNRRCHGVRGNLDQNRTIPKLEPRSKPKPKTHEPIACEIIRNATQETHSGIGCRFTIRADSTDRHDEHVRRDQQITSYSATTYHSQGRWGIA